MTNKEKFNSLFLDITEQEYRKIDALSYSAISSYAKNGPLSLIAKKKEAKYFTYGSLVETLLFDEDNFSNQFHMLSTDMPTSSALKLADAYFLSYDSDMSDCIFKALEEIKRIGIWSKIKDESKLIARFDNDIFWNYLAALYEEDLGKTIIGPEDFSNALRKVTKIVEHRFTSEFFSKERMDNMFFQLKSIVKINGIPIKGMLDIIDVDFEKKIIYPYDFKTGKDLAEYFERNFYTYKYYMQGGLYSKILELTIKGTEFEDFTIAPFTFIYINSGAEDAPIFKQMESGWNEIAMNGWENSFGYKSVGIYELIDKCVWHKLNDEYNYMQETVENNGVSIIKLPNGK